MEERKWCVYCHTNKINGKKYIGITKNKPKDRWGKNGNAYIRRNQYFGNAIKKYGWSKFKHEIIKENLSEKQAKQMEIELISKYNTTNKQFGYNLTIGGDGSVGYKFTEEQKKNHSKIKKETARSGSNHWQSKSIIFNGILYGHVSDAKLIEEINKYHKTSIGTLKQYLWKKHIPLELYQLGLRYKGESMDMYTYFSQESLSKNLSLKMTGKVAWNKGKRTNICINNRMVTFNSKEYSSLTEFAKENNICVSTASNILNGKTKVDKKFIIGELHWSDLSFDEQLKIFKIEINKNTIPKKIVCDELIFNSISECCRSIKYNIKPYLYGNSKTPQKYIDRGLRYYNPETDSHLPIYVDTKNEV